MPHVGLFNGSVECGDSCSIDVGIGVGRLEVVPQVCAISCPVSSEACRDSPAGSVKELSFGNGTVGVSIATGNVTWCPGAPLGEGSMEPEPVLLILLKSTIGIIV